MTENVELLLSEEFISFSAKIAEIHGRKKKLKEELRAFYDKIQADQKELEEEAKMAYQEFEDWKRTKGVKNDE